uniref:ORF2a' protein n=1 Tax=Free State vervet virus TaxID=1737586 RepID=A0A159D6U1_9NIDO|nr:ORF2a' protein [Free State vervet virus]
MLLSLAILLLFCPGLPPQLQLVFGDNFLQLNPTYTWLQGDTRTLHRYFKDAITHCERKLAPWLAHPFGLIQSEKFHRVYLDWLRRVYGGVSLTVYESDGKTIYPHWYHSRDCHRNGSLVLETKARDVTPLISDAFKFYGLMEHEVCIKAASVLTHLTLTERHSTFNVTGDVVTISVRPHSMPWYQVGFFMRVYHASSFSVCVAPITLVITLIVKYPRLRALAFPELTFRFICISRP